MGSFVDELLMIDNSGTCPVEIFAIDSLSAEFLPPSVVSYPLIVSSGGSIEVAIGFSLEAMVRQELNQLLIS